MAKSKSTGNALGSLLRRLDADTWKKGSGYPSPDELQDLALLANAPGADKSALKGLAAEVAAILNGPDEAASDKVMNALLDLTSETNLPVAMAKIESLGPETVPVPPNQVSLSEVDPVTGKTHGVEAISTEPAPDATMSAAEEAAAAKAKVTGTATGVPGAVVSPQTQAEYDATIAKMEADIAALREKKKAAEAAVVEEESLTPAQRMKREAGLRAEAKAAEAAKRGFKAETASRLKDTGLDDIGRMLQERELPEGVTPELMTQVEDALDEVRDATTPEARKAGLVKLRGLRSNLLDAVKTAKQAGLDSKAAKEVEDIVKGLGTTHFKKGAFERIVRTGKLDVNELLPNLTGFGPGGKMPPSHLANLRKRAAAGEFEAISPEEIANRLNEALKGGRINAEKFLGTGPEVEALKKTDIGRRILASVEGPLSELKAVLAKDKALSGKKGLSKMLASHIYELAEGTVNPATGKMGMATLKKLGKTAGWGAAGLLGWEVYSRITGGLELSEEKKRIELATQSALKQAPKAEDAILAYDAQQAQQASQLRQAQGLDPRLLAMIAKLGTPELTSNQVYIGPNKLASALQSSQSGGGDEALMGLLAQLQNNNGQQ